VLRCVRCLHRSTVTAPAECECMHGCGVSGACVSRSLHPAISRQRKMGIRERLVNDVIGVGQ